jgi:Meiotically up-regulated gene 113
MFIRSKKQKKTGLVYAIRGGDLTKIGTTLSLPRRLSQLAPQCPYRLDCAHVIKTDDMYGVENYWHLQFKAKRLNGEWFALDREDLNAFMEFRVATINKCGRLEALDQTTLTELLQLQTEQQEQTSRKGQKPAMAIDFSKHMGSSGYLKAADIDATDDEEMIVTIDDVAEVFSETLQKEQIEVSFQETDKKLTLNVTNTKKLVEMFGTSDSDWLDKKIKLYSDDSKTPQGAPCRTIKIKPIKKRGEVEAVPVATAPVRRAPAPPPAPAAQDFGTDTPRKRATSRAATAVAEKEADEELDDPFAGE